MNLRRSLDEIAKRGATYDEQIGPRRFYPTISIGGRRVPDGVEVHGNADVPDGTTLLYEVSRPGLGRLLGRTDRGRVAVRDGRFGFRVVSRRRFRTIDVTMILRASAEQPEETQELLGRHGEKMATDIGGRAYGDWFATKRLTID